MMRFVGSLDANVILRLLLNDLTDQHAAATKLLSNSTGQFAVCDTAIIEVVFVLGRAYGFSKAQAAEAIDGLMRLQKLNLNRDLFEPALTIFVQHPSLSFEDCCLSVYAQLNSAEPLWTFDKKLAAQTPNTELVEC